MKVFAIRDDEEYAIKDIAYLIYYEHDKCFYIELPDDADPWETPLLLSSFVKKGEKTVNSYWSKLWVQQRIVPPDRQNLGQVLKENGLTEYDEFDLLMLGNGRCAQDNYYLVPVADDLAETKFQMRYGKKVDDVIPLQNNNLIVFFHNGAVKQCSIGNMKKNDRFFIPVLKQESLFKSISVQTGGYGVCWGDNILISYDELYQAGADIPLSMDDFIGFISCRVVNTGEAAALLDCSRQNINDLVLRGKLNPIKVEQKNKYFLKSEILSRLWN